MEATQKSYKEYVFYDSLKKGLIKECLNPNGKEFRNWYVCERCPNSRPKSRSHMIDHVVCEKHNLNVATNSKNDEVQSSEVNPLMKKIERLEKELQDVKENRDAEIASLQIVIKTLTKNW